MQKDLRETSAAIATLDKNSKDYQTNLSALEQHYTKTSKALSDHKQHLTDINTKAGIAKTGFSQLKDEVSNLSQSFSGLGNLMTGAIIGGLIAFSKKLYDVTLQSEKFHVMLNSFTTSNFNGDVNLAEQTLEEFRIATARTVSDGNLIKLSNQASDLGVSLDKQTQFFALSKEASERMGIGVEEAFQKIVLATEGSSKGLKSLGIQKEEYKQTLDGLVKSAGGELESMKNENGETEITIKKLDAETQKRLRIEAILKLTNSTRESALNTQQNEADKLEATNVEIENLNSNWGKYIQYIFPDVIGAWKSLASIIGSLKKVFTDFKTGMDTLDMIIPGSGSAITALAGAYRLLRQEIEGANQAAKNMNINANISDQQKQLGLNTYDSKEKAIRDAMYQYHLTKEQAEQQINKIFSVGETKTEGANQSDFHVETQKSGKTQKEKEDLDKVQQLEKDILDIKTLILNYKTKGYNIDKERAELNEKEFQLLVETNKVDFSLDVNKLKSKRADLGDETIATKLGGGIPKITQSIAQLKVQLVGMGALSGLVNGLSNSFNGLFASLVPPQGADSPLKQFLKSVVNSIINAVEASILAAEGFAAASSVLSFGLSLIKDAPLLAAALVALEAAKGFIGGFAEGGYTGSGGKYHPAGVVHAGEYVVPAHMSSIFPMLEAMRTGSNSKSVQYFNGGIVRNNAMAGDTYIIADIDGLTFMKTNDPKYKAWKRNKKI